MRQCEYKRRYDPEIGRYVKTHIYGGGISNVFKSIRNRLFGRTMKNKMETGLRKGSEKLVEAAANKTGNFAAKKAGDRIIQLLSKDKTGMQSMTQQAPTGMPSMTRQAPTVEQKPLTDYEINERVNQLISGGKLRKFKFI
nr:TPA_asm: hypothetical protein [Corynactis coral adintovirus]